MMSQKDTQTLMNLSNATKSLVNQGVFSLFAITKTKENAVFLLCAHAENFLLDVTGGVVGKIESPTSVEIKGSIKFPEVPLQTYAMGKLNIA